MSEEKNEQVMDKAALIIDYNFSQGTINFSLRANSGIEEACDPGTVMKACENNGIASLKMYASEILEEVADYLQGQGDIVIELRASEDEFKKLSHELPTFEKAVLEYNKTNNKFQNEICSSIRAKEQTDEKQVDSAQVVHSVEEEEQEEKVDISKEEIKNNIHISAGQRVEYIKKEIKLFASITCEGTLVFDRCLLVYNGDHLTGQVVLANDGEVIFSNCTIVGKNNENINDNNSQEYFVCGNGNSLLIEKTIFYNCRFFINTNTQVQIQDCKMLYTKEQIITNLIKAGEYKNSRMTNCLIENEFHSKKYSIDRDYIFKNISNVTSCTFKNLSKCFFNGNLILNNSHFIECGQIIICKEKATITYCHFETCGMIIGTHSLLIKYCQFIECYSGSIGFDNTPAKGFNMDEDGKFSIDINEFDPNILNHLPNNYIHEAIIDQCEFFNCLVPYSEALINFIDIKDDKNKTKIISNCLFDGLNIFESNKLIEYVVNKKTKEEIQFVNCDFKHCINKNGDFIIITESNYKDYSELQLAIKAQIKNCKGLDIVNKEGDKADNFVIREKTPTDDLIGAMINESKIGIPGMKEKGLI